MRGILCTGDISRQENGSFKWDLQILFPRFADVYILFFHNFFYFISENVEIDEEIRFISII